MLRIRLLLGLEAACIPQEELSDVKALKQDLNRLHGFPLRFRQKLFRGSSLNTLDDTAKLDCETELDLVLLNVCRGISSRSGLAGDCRRERLQSRGSSFFKHAAQTLQQTSS